MGHVAVMGVGERLGELQRKIDGALAGNSLAQVTRERLTRNRLLD